MIISDAELLLLTGKLGNPERKPISVPQYWVLHERLDAVYGKESLQEFSRDCLKELGLRAELSARIINLLSERSLLNRYLLRGVNKCCVLITQNHPLYPAQVYNSLGHDAPICYWAKGNVSILKRKTVSLVGSRNLERLNYQFAYEAGRQAAGFGYALVSGNARGADVTGQNACLQSGGEVISIISDSLENYSVQDNTLYLSEESFDAPFSTARALHRNHSIHAMGEKTFVAQSDYEKGGTWNGTVCNLKHGWSPVFCCKDDSKASKALEAMGAGLITIEELRHLDKLSSSQISLFGI